MKALLSVLLMGIAGNGALLKPVVLRLNARLRRETSSRAVAATSGLLTGFEPGVDNADDGLLEVPEILAFANRSSTTLLLQRYALAQTLFGRLLLELHVEFHRMVAIWRFHSGPGVKRAFDILVSLVTLLLLSPLFLLIAVLVKLEDRGPVFFAQTRVGENGREFKMYKVRSMCCDAEKRLQELLAKNQHREGVTFKLKDDPRITKVGKWLRKFSLDELPQFYNVLIGDMSLVGPRPPVPREVAKYSMADRRRLAAKPGITCIWQISGRSEIDFSGQVQLDVNYIETCNFWTDLNILFRTVPAVISGKGAC